MRLIVQYIYSDDCTFSCTITAPVIYPNAAQFLIEFEHQCILADKRSSVVSGYDFELGGQSWDVTDFWDRSTSTFIPPDVFTVDEYFKRVEQQ